jgi:hypothetical protein
MMLYVCIYLICLPDLLILLSVSFSLSREHAAFSQDQCSHMQKETPQGSTVHYITV